MAAFGRIIALTVIGLFCICSSAVGGPDTSFHFRACNEDSFGNSDPFAYSLAYVLSDLETVTPNRPGFDYYTASPYPEAVTYGHASCNSQLSYPDCVTCISYVKGQLLDACPNRIGAQLALQDCKMRYEQYPFAD